MVRRQNCIRRRVFVSWHRARLTCTLMHTLLCLLGALAADEVSFRNNRVENRASSGLDYRYLTAFAQMWYHAMLVPSVW
ncbi:hypothetical protein HBI56_214620 [Parastagonospora nodorum]|uniref:Uncharacterized protein n=1 Tax=Phaeosphaeria nodorum (strain SN15 / ATCC MYA-4574 / FGSC 10173) TaxID=321614 RepID=A0A7U2F860_PHANO|nr:hypothetical protein HBH56_230580 [Parastagonospora nodorum]QRC99423.1 hypothetical protein JI435_413440 [Parastagonospora nodorum SN15]KAH3924443.1 hypothetical protein HBH54_194590 [Parastagonospora nodorum]KAH3940141.1 hypothetical protein HBH53_222180 [Parastagonospora nodorum]KAH3958370.1 hypothetical protein HBH51_210300 [Parastagonospora nodorum]